MIDVTFDFRLDTPAGLDPDKYSATLRRYHKQLWSKSLPNGTQLVLEDTVPGAYLCHRSPAGEIVLASDAVIPSFRKERSLADVYAQLATEEREAFMHITYTIGGMMVFPGRRIGGKMTINQVRGCHPLIKDRFDLTLECIRRRYSGERSPLSEVLQRYDAYFDLFESFAGYVEFFMLQDLVSRGGTVVRIAHPHDDFRVSPVPASLEQYREYCARMTEFVVARNARILKQQRK